MIHGISHITLLVKDLNQSSHLFQHVFDAKEVYSSDGKNFSLSSEKFFLIGGIWFALMEGPQLERSYRHIAFQIMQHDLPLYRFKVNELNLEILPGRARSHEEGESLYFYDYDNHLFELHTGTLKSRLEFYHLNND